MKPAKPRKAIDWNEVGVMIEVKMSKFVERISRTKTVHKVWLSKNTRPILAEYSSVTKKAKERR